MALYRQLLKRALASYWCGTEQVATEGGGIYYQGGPLSGAPYGLQTGFPYKAKGIPDQFFFGVAGLSQGTVMTVELGLDRITRQSTGGPTGGWRDVEVPVTLHLWNRGVYQHAEQTETACDDMIEAVIELIYADRTLGTTNAALYPNPPWPNNRLIEEAGEGPFGIRSMMGEPDFTGENDLGNILETESIVSFVATTYWPS